VEGFLPVDDFLAQLQMGHAKIAFGQKRFADAEKAFRAVYEQHPGAAAAPEARYWEGVAAYKGTNDAKHLGLTGADLKARYPDSEWARKASVWLPQQATQP
jgi:TolA-binding protein